MTRNARIGFLVAAAAVVVVALIVIGTGGSDSKDTSTTATAPTATPTNADSQTANGQSTPEPVATQPPFQVIQVKDGQAVGGIQKISVNKGDHARYMVEVDKPENIHTHGYDIEMPATPAKPAKFDFVADVDGVYEIELEDEGVQIAQLTVNP